MTIVGFNFLKVTGEKKSPIRGPVKVNYNVSIKDVMPGDIMLGKTTQKGLRFIFEFKTIFEDNVGEIILNGEVLWIEKDETVTKTLDSWKNKKPIEIQIMEPIMGTVWSKCILEAVIISREVNLPTPFPMPKINVKPNEAPAKTAAETSKKEEKPKAKK